MEQFDAIIIGAGPAGMMAAIRAAERNKNVLLVERNNIPGKKLLISGKGRCNLTNSCDIEDFLEKFSQSRDFLRNSFAKFFNTDLMSFFEDAHVKLKTERGGRVFPESDRSGDILNVLKLKLKNKNIKVLLGERVREIIIRDKKIEGPGAFVFDNIEGSFYNILGLPMIKLDELFEKLGVDFFGQFILEK